MKPQAEWSMVAGRDTPWTRHTRCRVALRSARSLFSSLVLGSRRDHFRATHGAFIVERCRTYTEAREPCRESVVREKCTRADGAVSNQFGRSLAMQKQCVTECDRGFATG